MTSGLCVCSFVFAIWLPMSYGDEAFCGPLPPPDLADSIIHVTPERAASLPSIIAKAPSGSTIFLADGTYVIGTRILMFQAPHVTLRSASGNRAAVILDGQYDTATIVQIRAPHISIADLTITRTRHHPIQVMGNGDDALLYNLHLVDASQQLLKINPYGDPRQDNDFGTVACSLFELTEKGRGHVETLGGKNPCYTGGIDAHGAWGWHVRDNVFKNIYCTNGYLAEHAVHFWRTSRDTVVERNTILNCARGIGFGLGSHGVHRQYPDNPVADGRGNIGHIGGVIRNNMIFGNIGDLFDTGIGLEQAVRASVYHNTVISTGGTFSSIDTRFRNSFPTVANNLVRPRMTIRNGARLKGRGNVEVRSLTMFVDPSHGNLHLAGSASEVIDKGVQLSDPVVDDIDGEPRDGKPDVGADEYGAGYCEVLDSSFRRCVNR